jgi:DnaJ-class molecular chaperone
MNTIDVRCPDCDGRGFTRQGPLEHGKGRAMYCDRCDGRGSFAYHVDTVTPDRLTNTNIPGR